MVRLLRRSLAALLLTWCSVAQAAISAGMVWEVRSGANDANGGGFRGGAAVSTPAAPGVSQAGTGGTVAASTYYAVVTIADGNGETPKSGQTSVTTTGTTSTITVTAPTNPGVTNATWNVYVATTSGGPYWSQGTALPFGSSRTIATTPPTSGTQAPGTDRSQQNAAQVVIDNAAITATTAAANSNVLTFTAGYTPTAADVGNVFHATAGTNIRVGWYEITAWTATTWTVTGGGNLTTAGGAGSAITGNMGGAFASPGGYGLAATSDGTVGNGAYIKYNATPYTCSATNNVSGGRVTTGNTHYVSGYDTTRTRDNTDANRPVLDAGAASMTVVTVAGNLAVLRQISVTNSAARATVVGINGAGTTEFARVDGCTTGIQHSSGNPPFLRDCWVNGGLDCYVLNPGAGLLVERCVATGFSRYGFNSTNNSQVYVDCVATGGTGAGGTPAGFQLGGSTCINCVSRDNAGANADGFAGAVSYTNCIAWGNSRWGYNPNSASSVVRVWNCAGGGNGTANLSTTANQLYGYMIKNFVTLAADPHTNAAGGDLSLNNTAGGGASCRAAGLPGSASPNRLPGLSTLAYPDLGPAQHRSPGHAR